MFPVVFPRLPTEYPNVKTRMPHALLLALVHCSSVDNLSLDYPIDQEARLVRAIPIQTSIGPCYRPILAIILPRVPERPAV